MSHRRTEFSDAVQEIMLREYGIPAEGRIEQRVRLELDPVPGEDETPEQWVGWYAAKYGLTKRSEMTLGRANRLMRSLGFEPPKFDTRMEP